MIFKKLCLFFFSVFLLFNKQLAMDLVAACRQISLQEKAIRQMIVGQSREDLKLSNFLDDFFYRPKNFVDYAIQISPARNSSSNLARNYFSINAYPTSRTIAPTTSPCKLIRELREMKLSLYSRQQALYNPNYLQELLNNLKEHPLDSITTDTLIKLIDEIEKQIQKHKIIFNTATSDIQGFTNQHKITDAGLVALQYSPTLNIEEVAREHNITNSQAKYLLQTMNTKLEAEIILEGLEIQQEYLKGIVARRELQNKITKMTPADYCESIAKCADDLEKISFNLNREQESLKKFVSMRDKCKDNIAFYNSTLGLAKRCLEKTVWTGLCKEDYESNLGNWEKLIDDTTKEIKINHLNLRKTEAQQKTLQENKTTIIESYRQRCQTENIETLTRNQRTKQAIIQSESNTPTKSNISNTRLQGLQEELNIIKEVISQKQTMNREITTQDQIPPTENNLVLDNTVPSIDPTNKVYDFTITGLSLDEKAFAEKHGLFKSLERPLTQAEQRIIEREAAILKELLAAQEEGEIDENQFTTELSRRWTEVAVESIKESRAHLENEIISYLKKAGGFLSSEELDAAAEMIKKSENYLELKKNLDSMLFSRKAMRDIDIGVPLDLAEDAIVFFTRLNRDPEGLVNDIANGVYKTGSFLGQYLGELLDEAECLDIESGSYNPARAAALCEKHANELGQVIEAVKKDPSGYARKFIVTYIKWRVFDAVLQKGLNVAGNAFKDASGKVVPRSTTAAERAAEGALAKGTCTVCDCIKPTQPFYPNTKIPKSFEIHLENGKFWVHPNATKHMVEYLQAKPPSFSMPINSQSILTDFSNAANMAIKNGVRYNAKVIVGEWEFVFSPPQTEGLLPVIHHALYKS
ncbi:hypothetical protein E3J79_00585 [Candidatus Dependentiae bacterium]|nr:MAG: hypothetical protein E3J79_00585 [Candidatus Dependentiae bacterium]